MFNAIQPKTPDAVLAGLQQHGASVGAKKLMLTSKSGPAACDVDVRVIRCAITGRLSDKCKVGKIKV